MTLFIRHNVTKYSFLKRLMPTVENPAINLLIPQCKPKSELLKAMKH